MVYYLEDTEKKTQKFYSILILEGVHSIFSEKYIYELYMYFTFWEPFANLQHFPDYFVIFLHQR